MNWLRQYIDYKGISVLQFEKTIGTRSTIDKAIKNNSNLRSDMIAKIIETYSEINPYWLLTGKGEMLTTTEKEINSNVKEAGHVTGEIALNPIDDKPDFDKDDPELLIKLIESKSARIAELNSLLEDSNQMVTGSLKEIQRLKIKNKQLTEELLKYRKDESTG